MARALELPGATCGSLCDNLQIHSPTFSISSISSKYTPIVNLQDYYKYIFFNKVLMTEQENKKYGNWQNLEQLVYFKEKY